MPIVFGHFAPPYYYDFFFFFTLMNDDRTKEITPYSGRLEYWTGDCFTEIEPRSCDSKSRF